jgi:Leucine-rich repeat (LRR) protein
VGKNSITKIPPLSAFLPKLDVFDAHSNLIEDITGLEGLKRLRVLNLASNKVRALGGSLASLSSLTELNVRRNVIEDLRGLELLPKLHKLNLGGNPCLSIDRLGPIYDIETLTDLILDDVSGTAAVDSGVVAWVRKRMPQLRLVNSRDVNEASSSAPDTKEENVPLDLPDDNTDTPEIPLAVPVMQLRRVLVLSSKAELRELVETLEASCGTAGFDVEELELLGLDRQLICGTHFALLRRLQRLRLCDNGITTFSELKPLLELFPCIIFLHIANNPVCRSSMLRSFVTTLVPTLIGFENGSRDSGKASAPGTLSEPELADDPRRLLVTRVRRLAESIARASFAQGTNLK